MSKCLVSTVLFCQSSSVRGLSFPVLRFPSHLKQMLRFSPHLPILISKSLSFKHKVDKPCFPCDLFFKRDVVGCINRVLVKTSRRRPFSWNENERFQDRFHSVITVSEFQLRLQFMSASRTVRLLI